MKVKTLRSILQTGIVLATVLLLSLAIILIVQFVEIQNLKQQIGDKKEEQTAVVVLPNAEYSNPSLEITVEGPYLL